MNGQWEAVRTLLRERRKQPSLVATAHGSEAPASFAQTRLWLLDRLRQNAAYNLAVACRLRGPLRVAQLERAFTELARRHEILRTSLHWEGELLQRIAAPALVELPVERIEDVTAWTEEHAAGRFDLSRAPLWRVRLGQLAPDDHCLLVVQHHAISDAWSFEVFMRELAALYRGETLPPVTLQYADFAAWQRGLDGGAALEYWRQKMRDAPPALRLHADGEGEPLAETEMLRLSRAQTEALRALAAQEGATLYAALLAGLVALLHRYTGEADVVVGSPLAGRMHLEHVLGMCVNTLPMRVDAGGQPSFRRLVARAAETATGAFAHQNLPLETLVRTLGRGADPLFEVLFALQNIPRAPWALEGLGVEAWNVRARHAKCDLALTLLEEPDGLQAILEVDAGRHPRLELLPRLAMLLDGALREPERAISELPICDKMPQRQNVSLYQPIHRLFEAEARRAPDAVAVIGDETLTYGELNRRANRLARRLRDLPAESLVGIAMPRSTASVVAQLAILKAGCAYVHGKAAFVLDDVRADGEEDTDLDVEVAAEGLAYVMFTSGSTGTPRGVCVPHRGVVRLVKGQDYARFGPDEVFLQLAPPSFDAATFETWGALLHGGTLVLAPAGPLSLADMGALIRRHGVTTLWLTAGLFELFVDGGLEHLRSLRQLLTGGDVVSPRHAERFLERWPRCRLINGYGPTENTTFTTTHVIERVEPGRSLPIGRPIANTTVHILDERRQPVPRGVPGELYTGGDGLARGYLDDDAATRERFVEVDGQRLYRTGDRVRLRADGALEFLGRFDDQLKVRGIRVEPAEIAETLRHQAGVRAAAVIAEDKRLIAYVVPADPGLEPRLRACLRVVPSAFVFLDRLPLTESGKLDRRALPAPSPRAARDTVPPRDELEAKLASLFAEIVGPVGVHDDFFRAGGDSLSAMRLFAAVARELGELPLATLFEKPTVAELAGELRRLSAARIDGLVTIREGRAARPLFVVAGGRGGRDELNLFAKLVARLDGETVYGLTAPPGAGTVEAIAAAAIVTLRRRQPRGPYRLAGECVGGLVAWEMAQQLGDAVELLLLVDTWAPTRWGVLHHDLIGHPLALLKLGLQFLTTLPGRDFAAWLSELRRRATVTPASQRYIRACMRYRPRRQPGAVVLLASDDSLRRGIARPWRRLAGGGLTVRPTRGDHLSYVREHAGDAADALRRCLEERP